jgi:hypothetical protein
MENFIATYENAYSEDFCKNIITYFEELSESGLTYDRRTLENANRIHKDDETVSINYEMSVAMHNTKIISKNLTDPFWSMYYPDYAEKYAILRQSGSHSMYGYKIQKTPIGGGYHDWHFEAAERTVSNRLLVWTIYLNDVDEGGETEFLYLQKRVKPKQGMLSIFPASFTHTHRGNPPISNEKYIMTGWLEY